MIRIVFFVILAFIHLGVDAQQPVDSIKSKYQRYNAIPNEIVHLHLNKSAFIKGEDVGFTAYVFDRKNKKPSLLTKNLHCQLTDEKGNVVKSKLVQVNNGFASNTFRLDSTMNLGVYRVKAFTNFMRNFDDPHYFETTIKINDENAAAVVEKEDVVSQVDVQFLPESGHLLSGVNNVLGVIAKSKNRAFEITDGIILEDGLPITDFKTSQLGIGRLNLIPKPNAKYTAKYSWNGVEHTAILPAIDKLGIIVNLRAAGDKVIVVLRANDASVANFKNQDYHLSIHNGEKMQVIPVKIIKNETILAAPFDQLGYGVNVFTLFDSDGNPIAERSFFNYNKLPLLELASSDMKVVYDSVEVSMKIKSNLKDIDTVNNFSVSVVPLTSMAINERNNVAVSALLRPFVKGYIDNPSYYFNDINRETKYEMDNLMLTQAWSGYDWAQIFNRTPQFNYLFELGISMSLKTNNLKDKRFMLYPLELSNTQLIDIDNEEGEVLLTNLFPLENEKIELSVMNKKGGVSKPKVALGFLPNKTPVFKKYKEVNDFDIPSIYKNNDKPLFDRKAQELNEILLVVDRDEVRRDSIKSRAMGIIDYFTDEDRARTVDFQTYLATLSYDTYVEGGLLKVITRSAARGNPTFVIDSVIYNDPGILASFEVNTIDFVEIDRTGRYNGRYFGGDIIKITTDPSLRFKSASNKNTTKYDVPLKFAVTRSFYIPAYNDYEDEAFKKLGVIAWEGNLQLDKNGNLSFTFPYRGIENYKVIVEGADVDGQLISSILDVPVKR
ncbi:MAG: hypothetical protein ACSHWW_12460 [Nonlabens sp.]|uniref:hypothetical protein n=1 Tax=Nonlabens sp. TaxID=1888209 RepID=UPI003EF92A7B